MDREAAWDAVWEALPARWTVGPLTFDPGRPGWSVTARGPHPGRGKAPQTVSGTGAETAALRDLDATLRGAKPADGSYLPELRQRLRLAYVDGAEEWTRKNVGRAMTRDELGGVVARFGRMAPGGGERRQEWDAMRCGLAAVPPSVEQVS
jgi:hypothetical protein